MERGLVEERKVDMVRGLMQPVWYCVRTGLRRSVRLCFVEEDLTFTL